MRTTPRMFEKATHASAIDQFECRLKKKVETIESDEMKYSLIWWYGGVAVSNVALNMTDRFDNSQRNDRFLMGKS